MLISTIGQDAGGFKAAKFLLFLESFLTSTLVFSELAVVEGTSRLVRGFLAMSCSCSLFGDDDDDAFDAVGDKRGTDAEQIMCRADDIVYVEICI